MFGSVGRPGNDPDSGTFPVQVARHPWRAVGGSVISAARGGALDGAEKAYQRGQGYPLLVSVGAPTSMWARRPYPAYDYTTWMTCRASTLAAPEENRSKYWQSDRPMLGHVGQWASELSLCILAWTTWHAGTVTIL